MKNLKREKSGEVQRPAKLKRETLLVIDAKNSTKIAAYNGLEKELNAKILEVTMKIKDHYPELSKYLDEMPVTVPSEKDPEITMNNLQTYYESLNSLLNKYKMDYPKLEEQG
jgi:hypothetical protein